MCVCVCVCVWNIGGMVLTAEDHIILRRSPGATLSTTNPLPSPWSDVRSEPGFLDETPARDNLT